MKKKLGLALVLLVSICYFSVGQKAQAAKLASVDQAFVQYGVLNTDLKDSTGHIYPKGLKVAVTGDDPEKVYGPFYLTLQSYILLSFGYGQVPEEYVDLTTNKIIPVTNYGVMVNYNTMTNAARYETLQPAKPLTYQSMFRLYNPNSGEHFYTAAKTEKNSLVTAGWHYEGIGWKAPKTGEAVYRMYNQNAGDHHYTTSTAERDMLKRAGWRYEGIGWQSDSKHSVPLYRAYNPNAKAGSHNYTTSQAEQKMLIRLGWKDEKIAWYGVQ